MDARYRDGGGFWAGIGRREVDVDRSCRRALSCDSRRFAAHLAAASLLRLARLILVRTCTRKLKCCARIHPHNHRTRAKSHRVVHNSPDRRRTGAARHGKVPLFGQPSRSATNPKTCHMLYVARSPLYPPVPATLCFLGGTCAPVVQEDVWPL